MVITDGFYKSGFQNPCNIGLGKNAIIAFIPFELWVPAVPPQSDFIYIYIYII